MTEITDTLICASCKGKKVVIIENAAVLCPKCLGHGIITKEVTEQQIGKANKERKLLLEVV